MNKLFKDLKSGIISVLAFIFLLIGVVFLFNVFPMNNYLSYLIALIFFIVGGMMLYNVVEAE